MGWLRKREDQSEASLVTKSRELSLGKRTSWALDSIKCVVGSEIKRMSFGRGYGPGAPRLQQIWPEGGESQAPTRRAPDERSAPSTFLQGLLARSH